MTCGMVEVIPHAVSRQSGYVASITRRRAELARLLWDLSKSLYGAGCHNHCIAEDGVQAFSRAAMPSSTQSRPNWKRSSLVAGSSGSIPDSISRTIRG